MRVCLLGVEGSSYTKMMCLEFNKNKINYDLILVKKKEEAKLSKILLMPHKLYVIANKGRFKGLSKRSFYFYSEYMKMLYRIFFPKRYDFESEYYNLSITPVDLGARSVFFTHSINHVNTFSILKKGSYDVGILAGVGIVSELILSEFSHYCLNAHPAPLPACKGGGALENTLSKNLCPSISIHKAVCEIDGGDILGVISLELLKTDSFDSIYRKLSILCCVSMAKHVDRIISHCTVEFKENSKEKLHYWIDCNELIQRKARENLYQMQSKL